MSPNQTALLVSDTQCVGGSLHGHDSYNPIQFECIYVKYRGGGGGLKEKGSQLCPIRRSQELISQTVSWLR